MASLSEKKVVILEHVANEKSGTIRDFLVKENKPFEEVRLFESGYKLPPLDEVSALIVMGGPMNVYEEAKYPFLAAEHKYIQDAIARGVPYLGICLGSQLLAKALGARVTRAVQEEVGWGGVRLSAVAGQTALFKGFEDSELKVFQWHGDTFEIPSGATLLASNSVVKHQAFAYGRNAFGLQFHLEVNRPLLEDWFKTHSEMKGILAEYDAYRPELSRICDKLYRNFFDLAGSR